MKLRLFSYRKQNIKHQALQGCSKKVLHEVPEMFLKSETATRRCSTEYMLLKFVQNSQENNCAGVSFLIKFQASSSQLF